MSYSAQIKRSIAVAHGEDEPVGWVFMLAMQPKAPMRSSYMEAVQDAVSAKEASVDLQYNKIFYGPLTWIAPIYP